MKGIMVAQKTIPKPGGIGQELETAQEEVVNFLEEVRPGWFLKEKAGMERETAWAIAQRWETAQWVFGDK